MCMQPEISVIIPTYKPRQYLWECLASLKAQTLSHDIFEILIILNGVKEPYEQEIQQYIADKMSGMAVRLLLTDKSGVSNARNVGIDAANGKYITFIDDDDMVSSAYLADTHEIVLKGMVPITFIQSFEEDLTKISSYYIAKNYEALLCKSSCGILQLRKFMSTACCKLIPLNTIGFRRFDVRFQNGEDSLFMALISDRFDKFELTSKQAVYYRRLRKGSLTRSQSRKNIVMNCLALIREYLFIYLQAPRKYNACFFATRVAGSLVKIYRAILFSS